MFQLNSMSHHVDPLVVHQNASAEQKREEELVLLKERPTHIAVQAKCEVVVDVTNALFQIICKKTANTQVKTKKQQYFYG